MPYRAYGERTVTTLRAEMERVEGTPSAGRHGVDPATAGPVRARVAGTTASIESWGLKKPSSNLSKPKGKVERVEGIEPSWPAWKAGTLPLSYTRMN